MSATDGHNFAIKIEIVWFDEDLVAYHFTCSNHLRELLDRLNPTISELSQALEHAAHKFPEARRLMTHLGVGPLTALAFGPAYKYSHCDRLSSDGRAEHQNRPVVHLER